ncbi:MAG: hypothetical protein FWC26_01695 [Fibromonadales bacterium]|nr:hypothetical protein [Fibromonadales bacterium]
MISAKLQKLLSDNGETVTNRQASEAGISHEWLRQLVNSMNLELFK